MDAAKKIAVPGILLFYEDQFQSVASTITEHLGAFSRYSSFPIYPVNLTFGLPPQLQRYEFAASIFHYTLRPTITWLTPDLESYMNSCRGTYKIAIFQDELWYFEQRFSFLRRCKIDCLYSRHKPRHVKEVYAEHVPVKEYVYYLAGYVADDLIARGQSHQRPLEQRPIDVGYRGRQLPFYMGRGSQEKAEIGSRFANLAVGRGLKLDIGLEETDRLYGDKWDRFLATCKAVLGVEGGVSVIDREGKFCRRGEQVLKENPRLMFDEFAQRMGPDFADAEDKIYYRSLTPRHFEAAAFRCLQILFEGEYDGIMKPGVHYVPLRKDFANLDEVLAVLKNRDRCQTIVEQAHHDLIASGQYSYAKFIKAFDEHLMAAGVKPKELNPSFHRSLQDYLERWTTLNLRAWDYRKRLAENNTGETLATGRIAWHRRLLQTWYRWRLRMLEIWVRRTAL